MNWHDRYKKMKSERSLTTKNISEITGSKESSIRTCTQKNRNIPRWLRLAIVIHEENKIK